VYLIYLIVLYVFVFLMNLFIAPNYMNKKSKKDVFFCYNSVRGF